MSSLKAVLGAAVLNTDATALAALSPARAAASRINGARSRGPKTAVGKARSAQNALKHGLRAEKFVVVRGESPEEFAALETALAAELAPDGVLQGLLAGRIARAAWRLERAERIEAELFERHGYDNASLGLALIRDGNSSRAFDTLLRYRGSALAELWRALRLLKALQAEAAQQDGPGAAVLPEPQPHVIHDLAPALPPAPQTPVEVALEPPIEPETCRTPGENPLQPAADAPEAGSSGRPDAERAAPELEAQPEPHTQPPASRAQPKELAASGNPRDIAAAPIAHEPAIENFLGRRGIGPDRNGQMRRSPSAQEPTSKVML
jgi:hypothetical protein